MGGGFSVIGLTQWYVKGRASFLRNGYQKASASASWRKSDLEVDLSEQHHLVTGANAGLGRACAEALAVRGASVHLLCRSRERGEAALREIVAASRNERVYLHVVDLSSVASVRAFATSWSAPVSSLINNAGALPDTLVKTPEGHESGFATMMCGTWLLTGLLLPFLLRAGSPSKPARVINISSGGMYTAALNVVDPQCLSGRPFDGKLQYAQSKRAQVVLSDEWARLLRAEPRVVVNACHPGWAETPGVSSALPEFSEQYAGQLRTASEGADTALWLAASEAGGETSGGFFFDRAPVVRDFPLAGTHVSGAAATALRRKVEEWTGYTFDPATLSS